MSEFKKLFQAKRILALVLALAMAVTMLPTTAYAAPSAGDGPFEEENVDENIVQNEDDDLDTAQSGETPATDAQDEDSSDTQESEGNIPTTGANGEEGTTPETSENGEDTEGTGAEKEDVTPAPKAEIAEYQFVVEDDIETTAVYRQGNAQFATETEASEGIPASMQVNSDILWSIYLQDKNDETQRIYLANTGSDIAAAVTYEWKQENGTALGAGKAPKDAGKYQLVITLPAKENEYAKAETTVDFEITKAEVTVDFYVDAVTPGNTAKDVTIDVDSVYAQDDQSFVYNVDNPDTKDVDESADNEVAFDLAVKEAVAADKTLGAADKLVKGVDYVVAVTPKFIGKNAEAYAKNYEFAKISERKIEVNDLKTTNVVITLDAKYDAVEGTEKNVETAKDGKIVNKIALAYDGSEVKKPDFTAKVVELDGGIGSDGKPVDVDIADAKVSEGEWHTAVYDSWEETVTDAEGKPASKQICSLTVGGKLEGAPVDAGAYVYRVNYEGDQKEYAPSHADIVVVIEPVELIIRPVLSVENFSTNQTAADVLAKVAPGLVKAADGSKFEIPATEKDSFWGTSYMPNNGVEKTQPYEPVFEVVETLTETTVDNAGKPVGEPYIESRVLDKSDRPQSDSIVKVENLTTAYAYEYIVRFSGSKAVYDAEGGIMQTEDINAAVNSSNNNYVVKADEDTRNNVDNAVKLNVSEAKSAVINTEEVTKALLAQEGVTEDKTFHDAVTKVYDGKALYTNRADYKKAKISADGKDIGVKSTDLIYHWYRNSYYDSAVDAKNELDENGNYVVGSDFEDGFDDGEMSFISPTGAGIYKLEISYEDRTGEYDVAPASVYFVIEKQKVYVKLNTAINYEEFSGITAGDFLAAQEIDYSIERELTTPEYADDDIVRSIDFQVEEKQKNPDGSDQKDADGNVVYAPMADYETFQIAEGLQKDNGDNYRVAVKEIALWSWIEPNYTVETTTIEKRTVKDTDAEGNEVEKTEEYKKTVNLSQTADNTAKVTVKKMGDTAIEVDTGMVQPFTKERVYDGESIAKDLKELLDKLKVVKSVPKEDGTKEPVTDAPLTYRVSYDYSRFLSYWEKQDEQYEYGYSGRYDSGEITADDLQEVLSGMVNGGTYQISVSFWGNEKYQPITEMVIATVEVTPKEITLTPPVLENKFEAGVQAETVTDEADKAFKNGLATIDGYLEKDAYFFTLSSFYPYTYPAWIYYYKMGEQYKWGYPSFEVYDRLEKRVLSSYDVLKGEGNNRYVLRLSDEGHLYGVCGADYQITSGADTPIITVKGNATVRGTAYPGIARVTTFDHIGADDNMQHNITIMNGISFTTYGEKEGNFVAVEIMAPAEYEDDTDIWEKAVYEASLEKAGGIVVGSPYTTTDDEKRRRAAIKVVFDAQKKEDVTFGIHWDDNYIETFTMAFSEAVCLGNLNEAVAPKTLAFNAPNKKMAVGETQELDVKMTKVQKNDVILLGYEVSNPDILSVNEYGKVTALATGSANVTVYAMHLVDGVKEPIKAANGKYAKSATVKITVTNVTAPKISKVTPLDYWATVQYPLVDNGYRREIYVLEGKNLKEKDFTDKINAMTNEQWEDYFAIAPIFVTSDEEKTERINEDTHRVWDSKKHVWMNATQTELSGLKANTAYTVYVRNVSAVRKLSDGSQVVLSAAGSVKSFATTKGQVWKMQTHLGEREFDDWDWDDDYQFYTNLTYSVKLSEGKVKLDTEGWFENTDEAANHFGDEYKNFDLTGGIKLPLSGADKKTYVAPKLAYYVWAYANTKGCYDAYTGREASVGNWYRSTSNELASIDKKGTITLKQPGEVEIVVMDTITGCSSNQVTLDIGAEADSIKAKTTKLQVGQAIRLENLVDYKEGKKVLSQVYYDAENRIDRTGLKEQIEAGGYFELSDDGYVRAVKKGGSLKVTLVDRFIAAPKNSAAVTLKSIDLAAVKNMKVYDVIDNRFRVQFEESPYADAYRFEVRDARKTLIRSTYVKKESLDKIYNEKTKRYDICWYEITRLTQQSKYTVTVTALYQETPSKAVTKNVATTKLPAYDYGWNKGEYEFDDEYSGINITVWDSGYDTDITDKPFVSGNTYTLTAWPGNTAAQYAVTDTLTWISTNTKVATVKANAGTYSATLNAVKNGSAYIEVWSKITKKLIARYEITVATVGDAYNNQYFYGDNEDLREDGTTPKPVYTELTLGVPVAVELASGQKKYFKFTAPEAGNYILSRVSNTGTKSRLASWNNVSEGAVKTYLYSYIGSYNVIVEKQSGSGLENRTKLELGTINMQVVSNQWFVFTAPEEGLYHFAGLSFNLYEKPDGNNPEVTYNNNIYYQLGKSQTIYLKANNSGSYLITAEMVNVTNLTADAESPLTDKVDGNTDSWYRFTAPKDGEYEFKLAVNGYMGLYLYDASDLQQHKDYGYAYGTVSKFSILDSGKTIYVRVPNDNYYMQTIALSVTTVSTYEEITESASKKITISTEPTYFTFAVPEDGFYQFNVKGANGTYLDLIDFVTSTTIDYQNSSSNDFSLVNYLTEGSKVLLSVKSATNSDQENVEISVAKKTAYEIGEKSKDIKIAGGSTEWFSYTVPAAGKYTFTVDSEDYWNGVFYTDLKNNSGKSLYPAQNSVDDTIEAGTTVYLKIGNTSSNEITVTVTAEPYQVPAVKVGEEAAKFTIVREGDQWFSFTPEEAGTYEVAFTDEGPYSIAIYNTKDDNCVDKPYEEYYKETEQVIQGIFSSNSDAGRFTLSANETVWFAVHNLLYSQTDFSVTVRKIETLSLKLDSDNTADIEAVLYPSTAFDGQDFSFKADENAMYTFTFAATDDSLYLKNFKAGDTTVIASETLASGNSTSYDCYLSAGETVSGTINAQNIDNWTTSQSVTVKVEKVVFNDYNNESSVQIDANSGAWYQYDVSSMNGKTIAFGAGSSECTVYLYDGDLSTTPVAYSISQEYTNEGETGSQSAIQYTTEDITITADSTIYLKIVNGSSNNTNFEIIVKSDETEESE